MAGSSNALDVSARTEDLKYLQALTVNVSNFVSVKLSGSNSYKVWRGQMLCLIKSQVLLHIIDAESPFPEDKGVHMIAQYEELVKGWIFGSMNENVLNDFIDLGTAREIWTKVESLFNTPIISTEGDSSKAVDVSAHNVIAPVVSPIITEDLKYIQASSVNVSSFVSVKLSGHLTYHIWKAQFICLVQSQDLLYILSNQYHFPQDKGVHKIEQYDKLVKGWIFSSMNEKVLNYFTHLYNARDIWSQLDVVYSPPILFTVGDSWNTPQEHLKYMQTSSVVVSYFVKLSSRENFSSWNSEMVQLIDSHQLRHIIDEGSPFPEDKGFHMINYYDRLVKSWFFGSMDERVLRDFEHCTFTRYLWRELHSTFTKRHYGENYSPDATKDLKYIQTSNVNVSNHVSVKLSNHSNYLIWKAQMTLLLESQGLLHIIDSKEPFLYENGVDMFWQYNELVRGWIYGSMNDNLLKDFLGKTTTEVRYLWMELESRFNPSVSNRGDPDPVGFSFRIDSVQADTERENMLGEYLSQSQEIDSNITRKRLYDAAVEGCWWKAKSILKVHKNTATEGITGNGNTILHIAVEMGHDYFLEKLLEFLKDTNDIEIKNSKGRTALHTAALVGNEYAAQLLVQKRRELLEIRDYDRESPFHISMNERKINMPAYMLKYAPDSDLSNYSDDYWEYAIVSAIFTKQYDLAETLLRKFPECAKKSDEILFSMAITFPTYLSFMEAFMYPSFHNVRLKAIMVFSYLLHSIFWDKCVDDILRVVKICNSSCCSWLGEISMILLVLIATLYPLYLLICLLILVLHLTFSMVYFLLWKVLAVTVRPIKNIEKKKKEYKEAKKILSLICEQMGTSNSRYRQSIIEAVRQGAYEVVDEILFASPVSINCTNEEGHNIIQLAIINRSEKVYNLIRHIVEHTKSYREMEDSSNNNLVHLAGRLAPSFVLNRSTGAALQLQRELLWHEEVEKLMLHFELWNENIHNETPKMMFTREHKELMKEGESWMKTTAESCSITAALIVTVVFAAAITVPGGSNQESGIPVFKKETAFTIFAISNAFSLFTAATALLLFLSILTARFSERDFLVSLPRRLIFGLFTLFLSTTSMIVAFGAILFLVFCDQRPWMLAPICGFACLPIFVIVTIKLPLLVDLIKSTYFPIFGKQHYLESCKTNRKNTIFVD